MVPDDSLASRLADEFLQLSRRRLAVRVERIDHCLGRLSDAQIWTRRHDIENAVGNLVLHLCGNITQWIAGGVGGVPVTRDRDAEFAQREPLPRSELLGRLWTVAREADVVLAGLAPGVLIERRRIQGYDVSVQQAVYHVVEHLAEHTGQIIWATKGLTGEDLNFYAHLHQAEGPGSRDP